MAVAIDGTIKSDSTPTHLVLPLGYSQPFTPDSAAAAALEHCFGPFTRLCLWAGATCGAVHLKATGHYKGAMHPIEFEFMGPSGSKHRTSTGSFVVLARHPRRQADMIIVALL